MITLPVPGILMPASPGPAAPLPVTVTAAAVTNPATA